MYSAPIIAALIAYGVSTILYLIHFAGLVPLRPFARAVLVLGAILHLGAIGYHHAFVRDIPILSWPSLVNLAIFTMVAFYLLLHLLFRTTGVGGIVSAFATVVLGTLINNAGKRLPPLEVVPYVTPIHIATSVIGFCFFSVAFALSLLRLVAESRLRERHGRGWPKIPPITTLDRYAFASLRLGFPFYTVGVILGALWAYWGGEEGALIPEYLLGVAVFVLYGVLIVVFTRSGWYGRKAAVLVIVGYMATVSVVLMYVFRRLY